MFLGAQRKLHHALEQLVGRQADEVAQHEILGVEPHEVAQLEPLAAPCVDEVAMAVVDDDQVARGIELRGPRLAGGA